MRRNLGPARGQLPFFPAMGETGAIWILQDLILLGNWTASVGLRWDHYQLLVNQNAGKPTSCIGALFARGGCGTARFLRSSVPDAGIRKYFTVQFCGCKPRSIRMYCGFPCNFA